MKIVKEIWAAFKASLIAGLAAALCGFLYFTFLGNHPEEYKTFIFFSVLSIPIVIGMILIIGIPVHVLIKRFGFTECVHYIDAAVLAIFIILGSIVFIGGKGTIDALIVCFIVGLLIGIPSGWVFWRVAVKDVSKDNSK